MVHICPCSTEYRKTASSGSHTTVPLTDLTKTQAFSDAVSHCKIVAQPDSLLSRFLCVTLQFYGLFPVLHIFAQCFLSVCVYQCKAEVPAVMLEESMQSTVPWKQSLPSVLLPRPVSCVSTFLGMWCVALEMTLAIHVFNDLKQFTSQLKQDLSCDNPKKILTKCRGCGEVDFFVGLCSGGSCLLCTAPSCSFLFALPCSTSAHCLKHKSKSA